MLKQLSKYMTPYRWFAILSPIMMIIEVFADVYIPFLMRDIINIGIYEANSQIVIRLGLQMILAAIIGIIAGIFSAYTGAAAGFGFGSNVRAALYRKIQDFSLPTWTSSACPA